MVVRLVNSKLPAVGQVEQRTNLMSMVVRMVMTHEDEDAGGKVG